MRLHVEQAERDGHGHTISGERILDLLAEVAARDERIAELEAALQNVPHTEECGIRTWDGRKPFRCDCFRALLSPLSEPAQPNLPDNDFDAEDFR